MGSEILHLVNSSIDRTTITGLVTFVGLVTTWGLFFHGNRVQRSLFYLNEIKAYYMKAASLLSATNNNNVNWHQAIEYLKMAESLANLLKEQAHQSICVMEIVGTGFQIINIIKDIDDFRFFYGIADYKAQDPASLFQKSNPQLFETPTFRIAPTALSCLCAFIDKVNRIFNDLENNVPYHRVFKKNYFMSSIKNYDISGISELSMKIALDYIKDFQKHEIARPQRHLTEKM